MTKRQCWAEHCQNGWAQPLTRCIILGKLFCLSLHFLICKRRKCLDSHICGGVQISSQRASINAKNSRRNVLSAVVKNSLIRSHNVCHKPVGWLGAVSGLQFPCLCRGNGHFSLLLLLNGLQSRNWNGAWEQASLRAVFYKARHSVSLTHRSLLWTLHNLGSKEGPFLCSSPGLWPVAREKEPVAKDDKHLGWGGLAFSHGFCVRSHTWLPLSRCPAATHWQRG